MNRSYAVVTTLEETDEEFNETAGEANPVAHYVNQIVLPVIVIIGIMGNFSAIYIIMKTSLKRLPSNRLLVALALSDLGFVITTFFLWIEFLGYIRVHSETPVGCKVLTFTAQICDLASVWFIVGVAFERFVVLFFPHLRRTLASNQFAHKYCLCVVTISGLMTLWSLITSTIIEDEDGRKVCDTTLDLATYQIFNISDTIISCLLPSVIILGLNCLTARKLAKMTNAMAFNGIRQRPTSTANYSLVPANRTVIVQASPASNNHQDDNDVVYLEQNVLQPANGKSVLREGSTRKVVGVDNTNNNDNSRSFNELDEHSKLQRQNSPGTRQLSRSLTRALYVTSTIYVLLNLPCYVVRLANSYIDPADKGRLFDAFEIAAYTAYYSHHALNFYFYTFFSPQMQGALRNILRDVVAFVCTCDCCDGEAKTQPQRT